MAGGRRRSSPPEAVAALHRRSGGLPRRVNQLAASALLEGFARDAREVDAAIVEAAAADLDAYLGGQPPL